MTADRCALDVTALDALLGGRMATVAVARDFTLLEEIARLARQDAPLELAVTDPALFDAWRAAVTRYHIAGWGGMTPERVAAVAATRITLRPAAK